jgi:hypothetical protein
VALRAVPAGRRINNADQRIEQVGHGTSFQLRGYHTPGEDGRLKEMIIRLSLCRLIGFR